MGILVIVVVNVDDLAFQSSVVVVVVALFKQKLHIPEFKLQIVATAGQIRLTLIHFHGFYGKILAVIAQNALEFVGLDRDHPQQAVAAAGADDLLVQFA